MYRSIWNAPHSGCTPPQELTLGLKLSLQKLLSPLFTQSRIGQLKTSQNMLQENTLLLSEETDHSIILYSDDIIGDAIRSDGNFQRHLVSHLRVFLEHKGIFKRDSVVLELGANIGTHSIYFERDYEVSRVIAVEPDPETFAVLVDNIALNDLGKVVTPVQIAVSDSQGRVRFARDMRNRGGSGIGLRAQSLGDHAPSVEVETTTVDDLLDRIDMLPRDIDLIWMDVESHELEVFRGMKGLLAAAKPAVFFEYTPDENMDRRVELRHIIFGNYNAVYLLEKSFRRISADEFDDISQIGDLLAIDLPNEVR